MFWTSIQLNWFVSKTKNQKSNSTQNKSIYTKSMSNDSIFWMKRHFQKYWWQNTTHFMCPSQSAPLNRPLCARLQIPKRTGYIYLLIDLSFIVYIVVPSVFRCVGKRLTFLYLCIELYIHSNTFVSSLSLHSMPSSSSSPFS